jgi:threonine dehydrogenase-like Zn-dependent dehydrogenase
MGGRVVVVGVCMREDRIFPLVAIGQQVTLHFVLAYTPEEFAEALQALGDGSIDPSPMVTRTVTLDELPEAFWSLSDPRECKVMLELAP